MAKGTLRSRVPVFREHVRRGLTAGEAGARLGIAVLHCRCHAQDLGPWSGP